MDVKISFLVCIVMSFYCNLLPLGESWLQWLLRLPWDYGVYLGNKQRKVVKTQYKRGIMLTGNDSVSDSVKSADAMFLRGEEIHW